MTRYTDIGDVYRRACRDKRFRENASDDELSLFDTKVLAETQAELYEVLEISFTHACNEVFRRICARSEDRIKFPPQEVVETFVRHMSFEGMYYLCDLRSFYPYVRSWIYDKMLDATEK